MNQKLSSSFLGSFISSLLQCVFYFIVFPLLLISPLISPIIRAVSFTNFGAIILFISYFLLPVIAGVLFFRLRRRGSLGFSPQKFTDKSSLLRLAARLLAIIVFLALGFAVSSIRIMPGSSIEFIDTFFNLLRDFSLYLIAAGFPLSLSVCEYLFSKP